MNKLKIEKINLYKLFEYSPYSIISSLCQLIDNSIKLFRENGGISDSSLIVIIWNKSNNCLQIMDNSSGISKESLNNIWLQNDDNIHPISYGCQSASFYLGSVMSIESKNLEYGFTTTLSLAINSDEVDVNFVEPSEIIRSFKTGTRITIDELRHEFNNEIISIIYTKLSFIYKDILTLEKPTILFTIIENGLINDISSGELVPVNSLSDLNKLKYENKNEKIIDLTGKFSIKEHIYTISGVANKVELEETGISISNDLRVIIGIDELYNPSWFSNDFIGINININIKGLKTNIFNNNFMWNEDIKNGFKNYLLEKIKPFANKKNQLDNNSNDTEEFEIIDEETRESLATSQFFLTKAFELSGHADEISDFEIIKNKLRFTYNSDDGKKITMNLIKSKQKDIKDDWLQLNLIEENIIEQVYEYDIKLNLNHPYFLPFMEYDDISHKLEHFVICYAIGETICRLDGSPVTSLKYEINKLLRENNDI